MRRGLHAFIGGWINQQLKAGLGRSGVSGPLFSLVERDDRGQITAGTVATHGDAMRV